MDEISPRQTVLCFSHDMILLLTRQLLLERSKYDVLSAMSLPEFRERLLQRPVDLIVLCQTLTAEECDAAVKFTDEHVKNARCLILFNSRPKFTPDREFALMDSSVGPKEFLNTVSRIVPARIVPGSASSQQRAIA